MGRLGFSASKATVPSRPWLQAVTGSDKHVSITGEETVSSAIHEDLRESLSQEYRSPRNTNTVARAIDIANANILAWQLLPQDPSELRSVLSAPWCSAKLACFVFSACQSCLAAYWSLSRHEHAWLLPISRPCLLFLLFPHNVTPLPPSPHWELEEISQSHRASPWPPSVLPLTLPHSPAP